MDSMYDTLLLLPLFQGLTQSDLTAIIEKVRMHFAKHTVGEVIARAGDSCQDLVFVLRGRLSAETQSPTGLYTVTEYLPTGSVIEPQTLFGMHTRYAATYTAVEPTHIVSIPKTDVLNQLSQRPIFLLNYINIVCNRAQLLGTKLWTRGGGGIQGRMLTFFLSLIDRPVGTKTIRIRTDALADILGETRAGTIRTLLALQEQGLLQWGPKGEIVILDAARLAEEPR